jgi:hypothetical protein
MSASSKQIGGLTFYAFKNSQDEAFESGDALGHTYFLSACTAVSKFTHFGSAPDEKSLDDATFRTPEMAFSEVIRESHPNSRLAIKLDWYEDEKDADGAEGKGDDADGEGAEVRTRLPRTQRDRVEVERVASLVALNVAALFSKAINGNVVVEAFGWTLHSVRSDDAPDAADAPAPAPAPAADPAASTPADAASDAASPRRRHHTCWLVSRSICFEGFADGMRTMMHTLVHHFQPLLKRYVDLSVYKRNAWVPIPHKGTVFQVGRGPNDNLVFERVSYRVLITAREDEVYPGLCFSNATVNMSMTYANVVANTAHIPSSTVYLDKDDDVSDHLWPRIWQTLCDQNIFHPDDVIELWRFKPAVALSDLVILGRRKEERKTSARPPFCGCVHPFAPRPASHDKTPSGPPFSSAEFSITISPVSEVMYYSCLLGDCGSKTPLIIRGSCLDYEGVKEGEEGEEGDGEEEKEEEEIQGSTFENFFNHDNPCPPLLDNEFFVETFVESFDFDQKKPIGKTGKTETGEVGTTVQSQEEENDEKEGKDENNENNENDENDPKNEADFYWRAHRPDEFSLWPAINRSWVEKHPATTTVEVYDDVWHTPIEPHLPTPTPRGKNRDAKPKKWIFSKSAIGSGKTTSLKELVHLFAELRVLAVTSRVSFAEATAAAYRHEMIQEMLRLRKARKKARRGATDRDEEGDGEDDDDEDDEEQVPFFKFFDYRSATSPKDLQQDHIICSYESLHKLVSAGALPFDLIIIDETESLASSTTSTTNGEYLQDNADAFQFLLTSPQNQCVAVFDANLSAKSVNVFEELLAERFLGAAAVFPKATFLVNKHQRFKRSFLRHPTSQSSLDTLGRALRRLEPCLVAVGSKRFADTHIMIGLVDVINKERREAGLDPLRVKYYHGQSDDRDLREDFAHLDECWVNYDLVLYTSKVTVGCDFQAVHFDHVFCFASPHSVPWSVMEQMIGRVRNPRTHVVHVFIDTQQLEGAACGFAASARPTLESVAQQLAEKREDIINTYHHLKGAIRAICPKRVVSTNPDTGALAWKELEATGPRGWLYTCLLYNILEAQLARFDYPFEFAAAALEKGHTVEDFPRAPKAVSADQKALADEVKKQNRQTFREQEDQKWDDAEDLCSERDIAEGRVESGRTTIEAADALVRRGQAPASLKTAVEKYYYKAHFTNPDAVDSTHYFHVKPLLSKLHNLAAAYHPKKKREEEGEQEGEEEGEERTREYPAAVRTLRFEEAKLTKAMLSTAALSIHTSHSTLTAIAEDLLRCLGLPPLPECVERETALPQDGGVAEGEEGGTEAEADAEGEADGGESTATGAADGSESTATDATVGTASTAEPIDPKKLTSPQPS